MLVLDDKTYFWLFWIIPAVVVLYILTRIWRKQIQDKFAKPAFLRKLSPDKSRFKPLLKLIFFCLALSCFILALVNPKIGSGKKTVKRSGVDIVFTMDVSRSMLAEDVAPNRLKKSKHLVQEILGNLGGDRVGIVAYAGSAFPQLPITTDYSAAKLFLNELNTDMVSSQGTAIAAAIKKSQEFYDKESKTNRIMFLFSDGEDHGGQIDEVVREASKKGIRIVTIGLGTENGGRIPIKENGKVDHFLKDKDGNTVVTKLGKGNLQKIAKDTDGEYINGARNTKEIIEKVKDFLKKVEKSNYKDEEFASYNDQFQWFLGFGILFTVINLLLLERKTEWLQRLNLFNENEEDDET